LGQKEELYDVLLCLHVYNRHEAAVTDDVVDYEAADCGIPARWVCLCLCTHPWVQWARGEEA